MVQIIETVLPGARLPTWWKTAEPSLLVSSFGPVQVGTPALSLTVTVAPVAGGFRTGADVLALLMPADAVAGGVVGLGVDVDAVVRGEVLGDAVLGAVTWALRLACFL